MNAGGAHARQRAELQTFLAVAPGWLGALCGSAVKRAMRHRKPFRKAMNDRKMAGAEPCIWCAQSKKPCRSCGRPVCPKHTSRSNGCCVPCIDEVQEAVRAGRCTDQHEEEAIEAIGGPEAATYGEVTPIGMRAMAKRLGIDAADFFVDLGSGLGRAVLQVASEFGVRKSAGIEYAPSRHALAEEALLAVGDANVAARVFFVCGDCADEAVWRDHLRDATVVFASNLLFGDDLNERTALRLEASEAVRVVATLKPFVRPLQGFTEELPPEMVETSWRAPEEVLQAGPTAQAGSLVYVYRR